MASKIDYQKLIPSHLIIYDKDSGVVLVARQYANRRIALFYINGHNATVYLYNGRAGYWQELPAAHGGIILDYLITAWENRVPVFIVNASYTKQMSRINERGCTVCKNGISNTYPGTESGIERL